MNIAEIKKQQAKNAARKPHLDRIAAIENISDRVERLQAIHKYWLNLNRDNVFQHNAAAEEADLKAKGQKTKHGENKTGSMRHSFTLPGGLVETIMAFERFRADNIFKSNGRDQAEISKASKDLRKAFPMFVTGGKYKEAKWDKWSKNDVEGITSGG